MKNTVIAELHKLAPSAIIELFKLELFQATHGINTAFYFHAGVDGKTDPGNVVWIDPDDIDDPSPAAQEYVRFPVEASGFEYNGKGTLPRPTLRVSNVMNIMSALLLDVNKDSPGNDMCGAKLTRIRTMARFLPAANFQGGTNPFGNPDVTAILPLEVYYIDRKVSETRDLVEFELASALDLAGVRAPRRLCIANLCPWTYRGADCGYNGTRYFDANDKQIFDASKDECGKRLSSCLARFGTTFKEGSVNGTTTLTLLETAQGLTPTMEVRGFGIPDNTTITAISNPGSAQTISASANESAQDLTITAPAGFIFTSIVFASYGTPTGTAPNFVYGNCHAERSMEIVSQKMLGASTATFTSPWNDLFGDPCTGTAKSLAIVAVATQAGSITLSQAATGTSAVFDRNGTIRRTGPVIDVTSATNIQKGMIVTGQYVPGNTVVTQVVGTAVEISKRPYSVSKVGIVDINDSDDQKIKISNTSGLSTGMYVFSELLDEDADDKSTAAIQMEVADADFWTKNSDTGVFEPVGRGNQYKTRKASWNGSEVTLGLTDTTVYTNDTVTTPTGTSDIIVKIKPDNVATNSFRTHADTTGVFTRFNNEQVGYVGGSPITLGFTPQTLNFGAGTTQVIAVSQFWAQANASGVFIANGHDGTTKRRWDGVNVSFNITGKGTSKNGYEIGNYKETIEDADGKRWDTYQTVKWTNGVKSAQYNISKTTKTIGTTQFTATLWNGYKAGDLVESFKSRDGDSFNGYRLIHYTNYVTNWDSLSSEARKEYQSTYGRAQGTKTVTYIVRAQQSVSVEKSGYEIGPEKEQFKDADGNNWVGYAIKKWTAGTVTTNYAVTKSTTNSLTRSAKITAIDANSFIRLNGYGLLKHGAEQTFYFVPASPAQRAYTFTAPRGYQFGLNGYKVPFGSFPGVGGYR